MQPAPPTATLPPALAEAIRLRQAGDAAGALALAERHASPSEAGAPFLAIAGLAALELGDGARALSHLEPLARMRPDDEEIRGDYAKALLAVGREDDALALSAGSALPALARIEAWVRQQRSEFGPAVAAYARVLQGEPTDAASWNNLGNIHAGAGHFDQAITAFEHAITYQPDEPGMYLNLADVLRRADLGGPRLKVARDVAELAPDNRAVQTELAMALAHNELLDEAIAVLEAAVARWPEFGESHLELGRLYEATNRTEALAALLASLDPATTPPEAAFLHAWLAQREGRFEDAARHAEAIPPTIHPMRREALIGNIAERLGDSARAFAAFTAMNAAAIAEAPPRRGPSYREGVEADLARWTPGWAARWTPPISPDPAHRDPVFLVGFPRSGTTLLDTMLMGLPDLGVLEERPMLAETLRMAGNADLAALTASQCAQLRAAYFDSARRNGWDGNRWLVDKHPLNMARAVAIHRIFPQARFILAERHPADVVLSCFMANFTLNHAMRSFTELEEAARTYDTVFRAWHRAGELFPINAHAVRYERLVEDPRGELQPLVEWLGLGWDDRLLDHTETARSRGRVRTASYAQIGEQLYTRARGRWQRYGDQLAPVMSILAPWAERMGYDA
ncbi:tetratricopeptide repeat-containing sulfotransferase family protein [Erythrobacter sp. BLCC-B19]|uniref:tetratricopeptide repeat-containing sulfotransferase family protein n=1 Tax=Erythrobacter sp. BLCC-B19 TaxID=3025315 RepID=UPI00235F23BA|nr:tetratricopeptide repeat-containing sulfotransferase family protein [Erythrobacter sp. BLCC-B19]WDA39886.1 sulfotransferase [Erythrobacter sp. BLCC-B19]